MATQEWRSYLQKFEINKGTNYFLLAKTFRFLRFPISTYHSLPGRRWANLIFKGGYSRLTYTVLHSPRAATQPCRTKGPGKLQETYAGTDGPEFFLIPRCTESNLYVGDIKISFVKRIRAVVAKPILIGRKSFFTSGIVTNMYLLLVHIFCYRYILVLVL